MINFIEMRVFNNSPQIPAKSSSTNKTRKGSKNNSPAKAKILSGAEVQRRYEELKAEKIAGKKLTKSKQLLERSRMSQYMGGEVLKGPEEKAKVPKPEAVVVGKELELNDSPNTADYVLNSDISKNKPDAEETREKLKSVLSAGAFNFSEKERNVLSKILEE